MVEENIYTLSPRNLIETATLSDLLHRKQNHDINGTRNHLESALENIRANVSNTSLVEQYAERAIVLNKYAELVADGINRLIVNSTVHEKMPLLNTLEILAKNANLDPVIDLRFEDFTDSIEIANADELIFLELANYIKNAGESYYKAGDKKVEGRLPVTLKSKIVSLEDPKKLGENAILYRIGTPFIRVSVTDQGYGISKENLPQIFRKGFSTKSDADESFRGIGLSLTEHTLMNIHGYLEVKSKEGKGTTFSLYFPVEHNDYKEMQKRIHNKKLSMQKPIYGSSENTD